VKIHDCFLFYNELEVLELHLAELYDVVDRFVLVEATTTFTGRAKPLVFAENRARFAPWLDKIVHVVVDDTPPGIEAWDAEHFQRNALARGLTDAAPEDVVILVDVDEVPRRSTVQALRHAPPDRGEVACLELRWYQYFFNLQYHEMHLRMGARAARWGSIPDMKALRRVKGPVEGVGRDLFRQISASWWMRRWVRRTVMQDAGWHFSWIGGAERVALKALAIPAHAGIGPQYGDAGKAQELISDRLRHAEADVAFKVVPVDGSFPDWLVENRERVAELIATPPERTQGQAPS